MRLRLMERHGARFLFFIIIGVFFHDLCLCFCFGWIEGSEGPWSDGDFMQRPNDLGQGVHSDSALGDANIIQVAAVSIMFSQITWCLSRWKLCTSVVPNHCAASSLVN